MSLFCFSECSLFNNRTEGCGGAEKLEACAPVFTGKKTPDTRAGAAAISTEPESQTGMVLEGVESGGLHFNDQKRFRVAAVKWRNAPTVSTYCLRKSMEFPRRHERPTEIPQPTCHNNNGVRNTLFSDGAEMA